MEENRVENTESSLHYISSSSLEAEISQNLQLDQIVNSTLEKIQSITRCSDLSVDLLIDLIMPRVKCELYLNEKLIKDLAYMKDSITTCMQQMQAVDQDIADIYLDLHNIYRKLERSDNGSRRLNNENRAQLSRRVQESEDLQKRSRHYLTNDAKELSAMLVKPPQEPNISPL